MPMVKWNDSYLLGVMEIDKHHQHLVELLNKTHEEFMKGAPAESIGAVLDKLINYATYHFISEEQLMVKIGDPGLAEHREAQRQQEPFQRGTALPEKLAHQPHPEDRRHVRPVHHRPQDQGGLTGELHFRSAPRSRRGIKRRATPERGSSKLDQTALGIPINLEPEQRFLGAGTPVAQVLFEGGAVGDDFQLVARL